MLTDDELKKLIAFVGNQLSYCDSQYARNIISALTELRSARGVISEVQHIKNARQWCDAGAEAAAIEEALDALEKYREAIK